MNTLRLATEADAHLYADDPVRPHLSAEFRTQPGRSVYILEHSGTVRAVVCAARTTQVPINEQELDLFSQAAHQDDQQGHIAVFYTVWSYDRGAGRDIIFAAMDHAQQAGCTRFVTLSPLTEMAEQFHLRNGATLLARHSTAQNFEYGAAASGKAKKREAQRGYV